MKLTALLVLLNLLFLSPQAHAQVSRLYFAGYLGLVSPFESDFDDRARDVEGEVELDNSGFFAGALGLRVNRKLSFEIEAGYRKSNFGDLEIGPAEFTSSGSLKTYTLMLNGLYNFDVDWNVKPFVTAGVGLAFHDGDYVDTSGITTSTSNRDIGFAYQVGGGLRYFVKPNLSFTGGYRFMGSSDIEFDSIDVGYSAHEFRLGLEYDLPTDWLGQ